MNRRSLGAVVALAAVAAALAAAVVFGAGSLALWTAVAVGVVALAAGALALYGGLQRGYLLARYLATRPIDPGDAGELGSGTGWIRVAGEVVGASDVASVLDGGDVAGASIRLDRRTHPRGVLWPGIDRRGIGEETMLGRLALVGRSDRVRVAGDDGVELAAPPEHVSYGVDDAPAFGLRQALQRHGTAFEDVVGEGWLGPHRLHVAEETVAPGQRAAVFGLLSVETDGGPPTLRPARGRGGTAVIARGNRLPLRYLRGTVAGVAGAAVLFALAWFVLSPVLA